MMNIYNGNVVSDGSGTAVVTMPAWFEALNNDFRYQLTTIGQPAQAWIASEITNGSFAIKTSKPGVMVEVDKPPKDQGLHPSGVVGARGGTEHRGDPSSPAASARAMKVTLNILGALLVLFGAIWFQQGVNVLPGSLMTGQIRWAVYGGITIAAGVVLLVVANPRRMDGGRESFVHKFAAL